MKRIIFLSLITCLFASTNMLAQTPTIHEFQMEDVCENEDFNITLKVANYSSLTNGVADITFYFNNYLLIAYLSTYQPTSNDIVNIVGDTSIVGSGDTVTFALYAGVDFLNAPPVNTSFNYTFTSVFGNDTLDVQDSAMVKGEPVVNEVGPLLELCETDEPYDLFNKVDVAGGSFQAIAPGSQSVASIINDHYFDPSIYVPGTLPEVIDYTVVGGNGCSNTITFDYPIINESPDVTVQSTSDATCGLSDGSATVNASGGASPYTYEWSDGQTGTSATGFSSQVYQVFVTDANGCETEKDVSIGNNTITTTLNITQPNCWYGNGDIDLDVTASENYQVWWSFGEYGEDHTGVEPGSHIATITTDSGCEEVVQADIVPLSTDPLAIGDDYVSDATCSSGSTTNDGFIELSSFTGGTLPLSFSWNNGVTDSSNYNLNPGTYDVLISDANGCELADTFNIGTYSAASSYWVGIDNIVPSDCNGSNGMVGMYVSDQNNEIVSYSWSNGQTSDNLENVAGGDYTLTYADVYGCTNEIDVTVPIKKPLINPICLISVDSATTTNLIVWEREETTNISGYNIYREEGNGVFNLRGYTPATEESVFNDVTASPKVKSWSYKLAAVNSCGVESDLSMAHRTSHLKRSQNGNDFTLNWNPYVGFDYTNNGVDIWRYTDANGYEFVTNLASTATTFSETVLDNAGIDYTIDFVPDGGGCVSTRAQNHNSSRSNRTSAVFNPAEGTGDTNNELAELDLMNNTNIYPNPSKGTFNIELEGFENHIVDFKIYNVEGKMIDNGSIKNNFHTLNLSEIDGGVYVVHLDTEFHNVVKRIIIK